MKKTAIEIKRSNNMFKRIVNIAVPASGAQLLGTSLGFLDLLIVSKLSTTSIAALGLVTSSRVLFLLLFYAIASAAAVIVSFECGRRNKHVAQSTFTAALIANGVIGISASMICFVYANSIARYLSGDSELFGLVAVYLKSFSPYFLFMAIVLCLSTIARAVGIVRTPFYAAAATMIFTTILNVCIVFLVNADVERKMAMLGHLMAWSRLIEFGVLAVVIYRCTDVLRLRFRIEHAIRKRIAKQVVPIAGKELFASTGVLALTLIYVRISVDGYAALTLIASFERVLLGIVSGLQTASTILISRYLGSSRNNSAMLATHEIIKYTLISTILIAAPFIIGIEVFVDWLVTFQSDSDGSHSLLKLIGLIILFALPVKAINFILIDGVIRAKEINKYALLIDIFYYWFLAVPVSLLLWRFTNFNIVMVLFIVTALELVRTLLAGRKLRDIGLIGGFNE